MTTPSILSEGYIIELFESGPWLTQDLKMTAKFEERGVWPEYADAEMAAARALQIPNASEIEQSKCKIPRPLTTKLRNAVNAECTCGGRGPDDPKRCPACGVWHMMMQP